MILQPIFKPLPPCYSMWGKILSIFM